MYTRVATVLLVALCSVGVGFGQGAKGDSLKDVKREFPIDWNPKEIPLQRNQLLTVLINNVGEDSVVGVETDLRGADQLRLCAWAIHYSPARRTLLPLTSMDGIEKLPAADVRVDGQTIAIDGGNDPNKRIVVHLSVPATTPLFLQIDGKVIPTGNLTYGLLIHNGTIRESAGDYSPTWTMAQAVDNDWSAPPQR